MVQKVLIHFLNAAFNPQSWTLIVGVCVFFKAVKT